MDEVTVNKDRLIRLQFKINEYRLEIFRSPYRCREGLLKLEREIDNILTGLPSILEEGKKYDRP